MHLFVLKLITNFSRLVYAIFSPLYFLEKKYKKGYVHEGSFSFYQIFVLVVVLIQTLGMLKSTMRETGFQFVVTFGILILQQWRADIWDTQQH